MWILSQNKTELVDVIKVSLSSVLGAKTVLIMGKFASSSLFHTNEIILGTYASMDDAKAELKNIQEHLNSSGTAAYEMK